MNKIPSRAVLYVATGKRYLREAISSAISVRRHSPELEVVLYTDQNTLNPVFDRVWPISNPTHTPADKILGLMAFRRKRGLFLDTDTRVVADITPLFNLLDKFDIALAHASWRYSLAQVNGKLNAKEIYRQDACPFPFCELNTGVILFQNNHCWKNLLREWKSEYGRQMLAGQPLPANDQPAFRVATWKSSVNLFILPPEYNYRCDFPGYVGSKLNIIHGRHPRVADIGKLLGEKRGARVFLPKQFRVVTHE